MDAARPNVFIAAPATIIRELGSALGAGVDVFGAETNDEAVRALAGSHVDAIIVCYAFDELRPFRLLHHLRDEWEGSHVPTILVRALPVPLGTTQEAEIRETYRLLGADEFFNLYAEGTRIGRAAALAEFRDTLFRLLRLPEH
jgi:methylmalonyl-CoA mutase cobalamin-binding subunit